MRIKRNKIIAVINQVIEEAWSGESHDQYEVRLAREELQETFCASFDDATDAMNWLMEHIDPVELGRLARERMMEGKE